MKGPMMHVHVDRDRCEIHAQCVFAAPEVFALDDDDELTYDATPPETHRAAVEEAARICPVRAITVGAA